MAREVEFLILQLGCLVQQNSLCPEAIDNVKKEVCKITEYGEAGRSSW